MARSIIVTAFLLWVMIASSGVTCAGGVPSPPEKCRYGSVTSYPAMTAYLEELDGKSPVVAVQPIGASSSGRAIPAIFFSSGAFGAARDTKPVVMVLCQQHGDEPSGKEAALILARTLLEGDAPLLQRMDLIVIPMANPDGAEAGTRRNGRGRDLNRNHTILTEPEVTAVHEVFRKWMPEVTLDVHEYSALSEEWLESRVMKNADEMLDTTSNLNISGKLRTFGEAVVLPEVGKKVTEDGFTFSRYIVGSPARGRRIRHSTTDINDGRQSFGIYNTLSFILEGRKWVEGSRELERRTKGQLAAIRAFLGVVAGRSAEILSLVREERAQLLEGSDPDRRAFIQMDYCPDPSRLTFSLPIVDLQSGLAGIRAMGNYEPLVKVKKSVAEPLAYLIPGGETAIIDLLKLHHVGMVSSWDGRKMLVEEQTILHIASRAEEESELPCFDSSTARRTRRLEKGDVLIALDQPGRLLIPLLLELESSWGVMTDTGALPSTVRARLNEGDLYPVRRVIALTSR